MIFTIESKALQAAMATAGRVIPTKSAWPILTQLKIVTNDDRITLVGSDSDTTFEADVGANVETEGAVCVPFEPLAKFVKAAKSDTVKFTLTNDQVKVSAGRSRISLGTGSLDDYPNYRPPEGEAATLDAGTFCAALRFALSAAEEDEVRHHIAGPNLSTDGDDLVIWGTDGHSAHRATITGAGEIGGGATLPIGGAQVILSVCEKQDTVQFMACERGWHLTTAEVRAWGKVIDAQFPDMARVVAQFEGWREIIVAGKDDLSGAINVATCGAEADSTKSRNLILRTAADGPVVMRGQKTVGGVIHAGRAEMDVTGRGEFAGSVSAKYFSAAIGGMASTDFVIEGCVEDGGDYGKAIRLKPAQSSDVLDMSALIMAQRVAVQKLADV